MNLCGIHIFHSMAQRKKHFPRSVPADWRALENSKISLARKKFLTILRCTSGICRESTNYPAAARAGRTHRGLIYKELAHTLAMRGPRYARGRNKMLSPDMATCTSCSFFGKRKLSDKFHWYRHRRGTTHRV